MPMSSVKKSRKLRRAETIHEPRPPSIGPSRIVPAPANPSVPQPAEALAAALTLRDLQHARRAIGVRGRIAAAEKRHVLDQLRVENADCPAGGREVRERIDVGDLDVVDDEQVLERAAAADDEIVAEIVGPDRHAGKRLDVTRDVLQRAGTLQDLPRLQQDAGGLHLFGNTEGRGRDGDGLFDPRQLGQHDVDRSVESGAHVHRFADERQALGRQHLQPVRARSQPLVIRNVPSAALVTHWKVSSAQIRTSPTGVPAGIPAPDRQWRPRQRCPGPPRRQKRNHTSSSKAEQCASNGHNW